MLPELPPTRFQCRHIFTDGHRCGSPALRHEDFCFYHHAARRPAEDLGRRRRRRKSRFTFATPSFEDRSAIQAGVGEILRRLASEDLDPRRAGLMLYGLQIASLNLGKHVLPQPGTTVEEVTLDPTHGPIAPPAEFSETPHKKPTRFDLLLERWVLEDLAQAEARGTAAEVPPADDRLPDVQAVGAGSPARSAVARRLCATKSTGW